MTKRTPTAPRRAIAYLRVSSEGQAESGLGLEAQDAAIRAAAERGGFIIIGVYRDAGLSGSLGIEDRPGLFAAIQDLRRGDVLLVAKRDRIGRDVVLVALIVRMVQRKGARILSAAGEGTEGDDAGSMLQRRILDAFSEYERLIIGQRTKAALRAKRERGERAGNVPYGYRRAEDLKTLIRDDREQAVLAIIRDCRDAGFSFAAICADLNRQGLTTRNGAAWRREYVFRVLNASKV